MRRPAFALLQAASACALVVASGWATGCAGAPTAPRGHVFYAYGTVPSPTDPLPIELPFAPLDRPSTSDGAALRGIELQGGGIRFARPDTWMVRGGSPESPSRYVQYVSPRAALVAVYERDDLPHASWPEVQARFEAEVAAEHSIVIAGPVPIAAGNAQGRAYHLRHSVAASGAPFRNESREILLRAHGRVVLVQVVYTGDLTSIADELLPFFASFQLL